MSWDYDDGYCPDRTKCQPKIEGTVYGKCYKSDSQPCLSPDEKTFLVCLEIIKKFTDRNTHKFQSWETPVALDCVASEIKLEMERVKKSRAYMEDNII